MNTDIDDYSYPELLDILQLNDPTRDNIIQETDTLISKFKNEDNEKLATFFQEAQKKLLDGFKDNIDDSENEQNNEQTQIGNWWQNQALTQKDKIQSNKYTLRKGQTEVYEDNDHMQMNRNRLGINQTTVVPKAQGTLNPNLKNINKRIVNIDSQFRPDIFPFSIDTSAPSSNTDYTLDLSDPLTNVVNLRLYSVQIPYSWYAVDSAYGNNCFTIDNSLVVVPSGNYTPSELIEDISNTMFSIPTNWNISYDNNNGKTTFTNSGGSSATIVFYGETLDCSGFCGKSTKKNNNLGWILGFRGGEDGEMTYTLGSGESITSEAVTDTYGTKYFLLVLDDYNQNHLNKGLVSIGETNTSLSLPNYYTGDLSYSTTSCPSGNVTFIPSAPRRITQAQIYSINEILTNRKARTIDRVRGPTTTDIMALIPIRKNALKVGDPYIEFGTTLQQNERVYFGPVDINRFRVRLINDKGDTVNLNGNDWSFSLISDELYQY